MRDSIPQITPHLRLGGRQWYLPNALSAFKHRNYQLWWAGQLVSLVGTFMQMTAQQWLVYRLTGSPLALGTVTFMNALPSTLLSLFAGVVVDRADKRRFLVFLQSGMMLLAFILAGLTLSGRVQFWHVLALATLLGLLNVFDMPTRQAFTVEMVGKEDLMNAIALNSSMFNGARLVGPALAGMLVARIGEGPAFTANGLSFLAVIAALLAMRLAPAAPRPGRPEPLRELRAGLSFIVHNEAVLGLVVAVAVPGLFGFTANTLFPVMADRLLGLGADGYGMLLSVVGMGALIGGVSLAGLGNYHPKGRLITVARFTFGGALLALGLTTSVWIAVPALMLLGWGMISQLAVTNTLLQLQVPDELRGRVMSAYLWIIIGLAPFGALALGWLAEGWGASLAIQFSAGACLLSAAFMLLAFPRLNQI